MKVKELIESLQKLNPDLDVLIWVSDSDIRCAGKPFWFSDDYYCIPADDQFESTEE